MAGVPLDSSSKAEPLLSSGASRAGTAVPSKRAIWFGFLPLWAECVPLDRATGRIDWAALAVNIGAGVIMGVREALGGIVSASLVFSSSGIDEITAMLSWGICMTLYTMFFGVLWYAAFGRLQYGYATQQDLICILQAQMAANAAQALQDTPGKIPATVIAIICTSTVLSGACSVLVGKLGLGKYMLLFPAPVTNGFLGAIGVVVLRAGLQTASGVKFHYFYPTDWGAFCSNGSLAQSGCMLFMVFSIRVGPSLLNQCFPKSTFVPKVAGLICQLLPLGLFYLVLAISGVSWASLEDSGWTYPRQASTGPMGLWTTYSAADVHWPTVLATMPAMPSLVLMSVMCTLMGALAITDAFPSGPDGDPAPMETLNFDTELVTVGASSMLLGLTGGNVNFHKFSVIQLRLDGGTHRIAVLMIALFAGGLFVSGVPIGQLIPKWFLAGLFVNTGMHFVKGTLFSYRSMPRFDWRGWKLPSSQGIIGPSCVLFAVFFSPAKAILFGLVLSITFFLSSSAAASPVINVVSGDRVVSRSKRPCWEMRVLRREGDRILLLYLQGQLFFGSTQQLVAALAATAVDDHVRFIIISLARVPHIDPSAARHLKAASEKLKKRGCEVIFCRMNREVFSILSAAKVVAAPDPDLVKHLQNLRWKSTPMSPKPSKRISRPASPELGPWTNKRLLRPASKGSSLGERTPDACADLRAVPPLDFTIVLAETPAVGGQSRNADEPVAPNSEMFSPQSSTKDPGSLEEAAHEARPDAFCHETDALDYCDERLVAEFCYSCESHAATLEPYMLAFRAAVHTGLRLPEWAFEDMNGLPRGMMLQLQKFCDVHVGLPAWTKISDTMDLKGALCFVLKGSVSVIQHVPLSDDSSLVNAELHGFSFRQGKRLLKRYPPGHVAGKDYFFNTHSGQVIDQELEPKIDVSSKLGPPAEIWVLRLEMWDRMPLELKATMTEMLCAQFADDIQHSRLQEH